MTKTIQRHRQHWAHKTQDKDNPETQTTLGTHKTQDKDNPETHTTLGTHKTQDQDKTTQHRKLKR